MQTEKYNKREQQAGAKHCQAEAYMILKDCLLIPISLGLISVEAIPNFCFLSFTSYSNYEILDGVCLSLRLDSIEVIFH